jgi:divalent metal cation (Fe/Co/Zn/Cd) transporter
MAGTIPEQATAGASNPSVLREAVRLEVVTVVWMLIEATLAISAGVIAGSALLVAFGLDSIVELVGCGILLWRLSVEVRGGSRSRVETAEERARWVVALALLALCAYVLVTSVYGLLVRVQPEASLVGIGISLAAAVFMPWLFWRKRRLAEALGSPALHEEAASSLTCGYMAVAVLVGVVLNAFLGWWWAESLAALMFLVWLAQETREALAAARQAE